MLKLVRAEEVPPPKPWRRWRVKELREKYGALLETHDRQANAIRDLNVRIEESARELANEQAERRFVQLDCDQMREERDGFEIDAENLARDVEKLKDDRELLLQLLGLSEHEFEMERSRLECRPLYRQLLL